MPRDKSDSYLNGSEQSAFQRHHRSSGRRGSQSSQTSFGAGRRESFEVQRPLESPRPQRSLDLQAVDSMSGSVHGQLHHHPAFVARQDSFPRDDFMGYAREMPSQYPDVSQISSVQVTPRPKPRAFPRTNPAYVGRPTGSGSSYKRINIEQHQPPTAIYNQRFYEQQQHSFDTLSMQDDRLHAYRHDRSDSDTSHSSYGINRLQQQEMTDSQLSQLGSRSRGSGRADSSLGDHASDSHSSQGSLRGLPDTHSHSSQGSLRGELSLQDLVAPEPQRLYHRPPAFHPPAPSIPPPISPPPPHLVRRNP